MKSIATLAVTLAISMCAVCPSLINHPASLENDLAFAIKNPKVAQKVLKQNKIWCDYCGEPAKVKTMKWTKVKGEKSKLLVCKTCRKYIKKK